VILHNNVTLFSFFLLSYSDVRLEALQNPTSEWAVQQLKNVFYNAETPKYLIRDRDRKFGNLFTRSITDFGIREIIITYRSP